MALLVAGSDPTWPRALLAACPKLLNAPGTRIGGWARAGANGHPPRGTLTEHTTAGLGNRTARALLGYAPATLAPLAMHQQRRYAHAAVGEIAPQA